MTTDQLAQHAFREEFRKNQIATVLEAEVQAALKKAPGKRKFDLGPIFLDLEPKFLQMEGPNTMFGYRENAKGLQSLDAVLGKYLGIFNTMG